MSNEIEAARQSALKQIFGGTLTVDEEILLRRFEATAEGREYRRAAEEMRLRLREVVEVTPKPVEAAEMTRRFEEMIRRNARQALGLMWVCALIMALWIAGSVWTIATWPTLHHRGWFGLVSGLFFTMAGFALWKKNRALAEDPDLLLTMRRDQELARQVRTQVNGWIFGIVLVNGMSLAWWLDSGTDGLAEVAITMGVGMLMTPVWMWLLRRRERALWEWWERGR
jgi:hypothetical protein